MFSPVIGSPCLCIRRQRPEKLHDLIDVSLFCSWGAELVRGQRLPRMELPVKGKSLNKEECVTCDGVYLGGDVKVLKCPSPRAATG